MKVIVDAFGGDNAPLEIVRGTALAVAEYGVEAVLCGDEQKLRALMTAENIPLDGITIAQADNVIPVEEEPTALLKAYADSSMAVGMRLLAEGGGDAFITAGSTGAAVVGATMIVRRIKGIKRPAIATMIPNATGAYLLIDAGANAEVRPEMLVQFGVMGSAYMQAVAGVANPRVALVNIGTEETKGLELHTQTHAQMKTAPFHFIGNIEGRELPLGGCDVAVTDGFTGNVILKLTEGMGKMLSAEMKALFLRSAATKMAALALKSGLDEFRKKTDYTEHGGAPLLGSARPVIKAHGSSNAKAFKNAIRQAKAMHDNGVIGKIEQSLQTLRQTEQESAQ